MQIKCSKPNTNPSVTASVSSEVSDQLMSRLQLKSRHTPRKKYDLSCDSCPPKVWSSLTNTHCETPTCAAMNACCKTQVYSWAMKVGWAHKLTLGGTSSQRTQCTSDWEAETKVFLLFLELRLTSATNTLHSKRTALKNCVQFAF